MELYGTLLLYKAITRPWPMRKRSAQQDDLDLSLDISLNTDNRGNSYQATNQKTKNDTAANMLMELALLQHHSQCHIQLITYTESTINGQTNSHTETPLASTQISKYTFNKTPTTS